MAAEAQTAAFAAASAAAGIATAAAALLLDAAAGDPPSRLHPTAWAGRLAGRAVPLLCRPGGPPARARAAGALLVACMAALVAGLAALAAQGAALVAGLAALPAAAGLAALPAAAGPYLQPGWDAPAAAAAAALSLALFVAASAVLLKTTVSMRGMERHALAVAALLEAGRVGAARAALAMIVKRSTSSLDGEHIASAAVESVAENTVDGVTGPLFYFGILGLPGAFVHRTVSTLDSMVGYRTWMFRDFGWFAARCDTALNYAPSRLTALCMVAAAALTRRADWRASYRVMVRDASGPDSANSGYPMAAMAGALRVRLEKEGCYALGCAGAPAPASAAPADPPAAPDAATIRSSVCLMRAACAVFACCVTAPSIAAASWAWWLALG